MSGRFSAQDLDDIKARNSLADVAGGYVKLRRAGARLVGPCPVCGGRVTSQRFEIKDDGESYVCAVCGKKPSFGHNRSHSMVATKRRFDPNLQRVRVLLRGKPTRASKPIRNEP